MSILEIIGSVVGLLVAVLIGRRLTGKPSPAAPSQDATAQVRAAQRLAEEARTAAARASQAREAADDAAIQEVGSRPHTDDPVADLEARLGGSTPVRPVGWISRSVARPAEKGDRPD